MRNFVIPCLLGACVGLTAACSAKSVDDDSGKASNGSSSAAGGTGAMSGSGGSTGGSSATAGTGGSKGGTGGTGGTGGSSGSAGMTAQQFIQGGPFAYPQNKKPPFCSLTTAANASATVQSIYNTWKSTYVVAAGSALRVQRPENGNDTVSEGIGYGMLAAVYMGDRTTFDGLWAYAQQHFDMAGMMNWHINTDGTTATQGSGSATDADEDMAWALIMASGQWSSADYYAAGKKLAGAIMFNEVAGDGMLTPGDAWGSTNKTYPDYFSPAYYRVFKQVTGNANWDIVISRNYDILSKVSGTDGLVPDSTTSSYDLSGAYKYDACRAPWRIGMDYCFNGPDVAPGAKTYLDLVGTFFDGVGVANIGDGYTLTGMRTSDFPNMAFIGPAGVAGMYDHQKLLDDAFNFGATGNGGTTGYFQQSLRVITMLVMSGNFIDYTQQ
ncbi:MAG TPA: glycosyl hydrolase family 8 [Polyangiaceae bacterium]|nr:glycosyl hydrolase family 8 [Polyangiaceae bacterium]